MSRELERVKTIVELLQFKKNPKIFNYIDIGGGDGSIAYEISVSLGIKNTIVADILPPPEQEYKNLTYIQISE